jgi:hypothetical protein
MTHFSETKKLLENSSLFYIICVNMEGKYSYLNNRYKLAFASIHGDILGQPYKITMHPDDTDVCKSVSAKCFQYPDKVFPATIRKHDGKGGYVVTQWEYKAKFNELGEPEGIFCLGYDITEFQNNARLLLSSQETLDHQDGILKEIAFCQSHIVRKPVANILGLGLVLEHMEMEPNLKSVVRLIIESAKELDLAIKSIVDTTNT